MFYTELNPTILKIFHDDDVTRCDRLTNGLQELLELLFATSNLPDNSMMWTVDPTLSYLNSRQTILL